VKRVLSVCFALIVCLPLCVYAASIGGAETQGRNKFSIGVDQEFLFDRDEKDSGRVQIDGPQTEYWKTKPEVDNMYRTMAKVSYGLLDNLDVYVRLGTAKFDYTEKIAGTWTNPAGVGIPPAFKGTFSGSSKYKSTNAFAYGFGIKGTYPLKNDWLVGCDLQYLSHKNDFTAQGSLTIYDDTGRQLLTSSGERKGTINLYEWHVAPYVAKKIGNFTPYFGVRYSDARMKEKDEWGTTSMKADYNVGVFLGTDYKLGKNWRLNLEGRFIDETAMSVGASYRF